MGIHFYTATIWAYTHARDKSTPNDLKRLLREKRPWYFFNYRGFVRFAFEDNVGTFTVKDASFVVPEGLELSSKIFNLKNDDTVEFELLNGFNQWQFKGMTDVDPFKNTGSEIIKW